MTKQQENSEVFTGFPPLVPNNELAELWDEIRGELRASDELRGDLDRLTEQLAQTKASVKVLAERYEQLSQAAQAEPRTYPQGPMP